MTVSPSQYHRTFMFWPRQVQPGDFHRAIRNANKQRQSNGPPQTSMGLPSGHAVKRTPIHQALLARGSKVVEVQIEEKNDQRFEQYASPWELIWSRLIIPWVDWRFIPVVDDSAMVVGYCGMVGGHNLLYESNGSLSHLGIGVEEFLAHNRLYVGTKAFYSGKHLKEYIVPFRQFSVFTDIYGEVTSVTSLTAAGNNGETYSISVTPVAWLRLIGAGARILTSIGRFGVRTLGRAKPLPPTGGGGTSSGGTKTVGTPEGIGDAGLRERYAVMRFEQSAGSKTIYYDKSARPEFGVPANGVKYPDVTVKYSNKSVALSEAKGNSADKAIVQLESAGKYHSNIKYQEIVVSHTKDLQHPDGGGAVIQVVGPNLATGKEYAWKLMDASIWPMRLKLVNGLSVRVIVMNKPDSHFPLPPQL